MLLRDGTSLRARFPVVVTSLVGRDREVERLRETLRAARLVTLRGPGGVGKTRLALELAARGLEAGEVVALVELASLSDGPALRAAVAGAVGLAPSSTRDLIARWPAGRLLLVLDGAEHLVEPCAELVVALLQGVGGLRILTTSRRPLHVAGERQWLVQPLALPTASEEAGADLGRNPAVHLFVDRMGLQQPHFRLSASNAPAVAAVCRQLGGLPLGLELAAIRVPLFGLQEVAARLTHEDDPLGPRARTRAAQSANLATTVARSVGLLTPASRELLGRVAVFAGGWTLEAAEAVCADAELPREQVFTTLRGLARQALVEVDRGGAATRFALAPIVRTYALRHLVTDAQVGTLRARLRQWCLALAESVTTFTHGRPEVDALARELDNIRTVLDEDGAGHGRVDALRLFVACWPLWLGWRHAEGRQWLCRLWGAGQPGADRAVQARARWLVGVFALQIGDAARAETALRAAVALATEVGEAFIEATAGYALGEAQLEQGQCARARATFAAALDVARIRAPHISAGIEARLAAASLRAGDLEAARAHSRPALLEAELSGLPWNLTRAWATVGELARAEGDARLAARAFEHALRTAHAAGEPYAWVTPALSLAETQLARHQPLVAANVLREILAADESTGAGLPSTLVERVLAQVAATLAATEPERAARLAAALGRVDGPRASAALLGEARVAVEAVIADNSPRARLSRRELEIAQLLAHELSNRAIARRLGLSEGTVRVHVSHIFNKLGLHSRVQVAGRLRDQDAKPITSTDT